ncbi:hypothetical protein Efla_006718 [Eimeria flavescens]
MSTAATGHRWGHALKEASSTAAASQIIAATQRGLAMPGVNDGEPSSAGAEATPPLLQHFLLCCNRYLQCRQKLLQLTEPSEHLKAAEREKAAEFAAATTALLETPDSTAHLSHRSAIDYMCRGGGLNFVSSIIDSSPEEAWGVAAAQLLASQPETVLRQLASEKALNVTVERLCGFFFRHSPSVAQRICAVEDWEEKIRRHEVDSADIPELLRKLKMKATNCEAEEGVVGAPRQCASISQVPPKSVPPIKEYIEYTVRSTLLASNFLRELHDRNEKLLKFLTQPDVQTELVRLLTEVEFDATDTARHFALPFYAADVFCLGAPELDRAFLRGEETSDARDRFWNILKSEPPLNSVLAGYFSRCWQSFLRSCPSETCAYLRQRGDAEELLTVHLYSRSLSGNSLTHCLSVKQLGVRSVGLQVIDLSGIIPRLLKLLKAHEPLRAPLEATAAHGAAAAAARAALSGDSPCAIAAAAAAAAEAVKDDVAFQESVIAQLDPHLPVTLIIRELLFQRASLPFFPLLLKQLTSSETIGTLTDMILSDCASCLSSAVAIMSDLLTCTCIGKPLTCLERGSFGGESTPIPVPIIQHALQQKQEQQLLFEEPYDSFEETRDKHQVHEGSEGSFLQQIDSGRMRISSGGMSFTRGCGQQLERQSSLSGDDDDDADSDDEAAFGVFVIPRASGLKIELQQQQDECDSDEGRKGEAGQLSGRPDTSTVSSDYIRRAIAGLPEQPPPVTEDQQGEDENACQQAEEQQSAEQAPHSNALRPEHQSELQQQEKSQAHCQEYRRWRAECDVPADFRRGPSEKTREWLQSLERAEFVEQYIAPRLLQQLEQCCSMPATWRSDVLQEHEMQFPIVQGDTWHREEQSTGSEGLVTCSSQSVDGETHKYSFARPFRRSQREVHLPNGVFAAVGVEALELLTLVKALLRTYSPVVAKAVVDCGFLEAAVYLFFNYPWNSMLHISVTDLVQAALARPAETRAVNVIVHRTALLQRILKHFKRSQAQRVRRLREVDQQRCSIDTMGLEGRRRGKSKDSGSVCSDSPLGSPASSSVGEGPGAADAANISCEPSPALEGDAEDLPLAVDTPDGPFFPGVVAAAVLSGTLGRFQETCGYTSHLVQIAQLLMEQKEAGEKDAEFSAEWQAVVDAELAFYRLLLLASRIQEHQDGI